nr:unnamed protein product [Callosobruchus chinensis]
MKKKLVC